jgi:hypothetical protein
MRREIKSFLYIMGLGASLVAYAHANFATKSDVAEMRQDIREIRNYLLGEKK